MKRSDLSASSQAAPFVHARGTLLAGLTLALAVTFATTFGGACDSTATISWKSTKLERLAVISAAPLVGSGDQLERQCSVGPDDVVGGVELGFILKSTDPEETCARADDNDWALRPGDEVERREVSLGVNVSAAAFSLAVDCVEPYPDADILTTRECQGVRSPDFNLRDVDFRAFYDVPSDSGDLPVRCEPASVVLLIDQSGSMRGFVDEAEGYKEGPLGTFPVPGDDVRVRVASDPTNTRLSAAIDFIRKLNANDQLVVFTYHESEDENIQVPCTEQPLAEPASDPEYIRKALACFGVNRDLMLGEVASAFGEEGGRTPLWAAVQTAYRFLQREDVEADPIRHIVVVADGPDTCNAASVEGIEAGAVSDSQCSGVDYEQVFNEIVNGNQEPGAVPVHVHFVQLQTKGYPNRDQRMMELACSTQGVYQFVNGNDFPRTQTGEPQQELGLALTEALSRVRYALMGYWTLTAQTAAFAVGPGAAGYLAPGAVQGVSGTLTLGAGDLVKQDKIQPFNAAGVDAYGPWDLRAAFARSCAEDADCTTGAVDPCQFYCAVQEGRCLETPVARPDASTCTTGDGAAGQCCDGVCQAGACS